LKLPLFIIALLVSNAMTFAQNSNSDPIQSFLSLPMKGRFTPVSILSRVVTCAVDIDGGGTDDLFVGSGQPWNGDSYQLYCAIYVPFKSSYTLITAPDAAIEIDPRFFGPRETTFCGYVEEKKTQGLLVIQNDFVSRDSEDPEKLIIPSAYSSRKFFHIKGDQLLIDELGPLDLKTPEGHAFYERYFGKEVQSRPITLEDYPVEKLKEVGYKIPDWTKPPESLLSPTAKPSVTPSISTPAPVQKLLPTTTTTTSAKSTSGFPSIILVAFLAAVIIVIIGVIIFLWRKLS